ncbi:MAG: Mor transcription activator family protein [Alphaproteobacteria bacterium]
MTHARLPELLALVAHELGPGQAVVLAQKLGGQRVYVEKAPRQSHRLARILGLEMAVFLSKHYGGEFISVPTGRAALGEARMRRRAVAMSGASHNQVARELGITRRRVEQIRDSLKTAVDTGQFEMFSGDAGGETLRPEKSRRAPS